MFSHKISQTYNNFALNIQQIRSFIHVLAINITGMFFLWTPCPTFTPIFKGVLIYRKKIFYDSCVKHKSS